MDKKYKIMIPLSLLAVSQAQDADAARKQDKRPDIIVILADDPGYSDATEARSAPRTSTVLPGRVCASVTSTMPPGAVLPEHRS